MKVRLSPTARRQIAEFVAWWDAHRRDARIRVEAGFEAGVMPERHTAPELADAVAERLGRGDRRAGR